MKIIHGGGYTDREREAYRDIIHDNIITAMQVCFITYRTTHRTTSPTTLHHHIPNGTIHDTINTTTACLPRTAPRCNTLHRFFSTILDDSYRCVMSSDQSVAHFEKSLV